MNAKTIVAQPADAMRGTLFTLGLKGSRFTQARLKAVVETLPLSTVLNPLGTVIVFLPFFRDQSILGSLPLARFWIALGLHGAAALWALQLYLANRTVIRDPRRLERQLIALQFSLSLCWGMLAWLFWNPLSATNQLYIAIVMVTVIWAILFTRMAHTGIFLAGVLPVAILFWLRVLTSPGEVAAVLAELHPIWILYILLLGLSGRGRIDTALQTTFANEDLSAALRASNDDAIQKRYEAESANSAKTTFLANMSHELRTPLNAILGFSEIIALQSLGPDASARYSEYANDIHASGAHLLSLINDLLNIAKIEAGKMEIDPQPLDAARAVGEVQRLMAPRLRARNQVLEKVFEAALPLVVADERAFKQIVLNLVSNAVKFTPEGGRIEIHCRRGEAGGLLLEVEDNGPGIPAEKIDRVFQPFSQIDNRYGRQSGGTGLGLALVRGMTELHGGRAWIESEEGRGTKVSVYFPLVIESAAEIAAAHG